jgi:outer membrane protein assembly factor BamB
VKRKIAVLGLSACLMALASCGPKPLILKGPRFPARTPLDQVMKDADKPNAPQPQLTPKNRALPIRLAAGVANADWPQRMGGPTHRLPPLALATSLTQAWEAPIGKANDRRHKITAEPVVAGGRIFTIDSRSTVTATSTEGKRLWSADLTPAGDRADAATGGGLAYGAGKLFVATGFGELVAVDPATGHVDWRQKFHSAISGTPTVENGIVYVITRGSTAWAIAASNGKIRWQLDGTETVTAVPGAAGPALSPRWALLPFPSGQLVGALKPGGAQIWATTIAGRRLGQGYASFTDITGDPVVDGGTVFVGNASGGVMALDINSGNRIWSAREGVMSPVWPAGGSVFLISDEAKLKRLDAATGDPIWSVQLPYYVPVRREKNRRDIYPDYGPILAGGRLIVASGNGRILSFDPVNGRELSSVSMPAGAASEPVVAGRTLYVVTTDGKLRAFR